MIYKLLSWNINSIRIREKHLKKIIEIENPDIICLQETKVINNLFPAKSLKELGFKFCYNNGVPSYNGVSILSKKKSTQTNIINWCNNSDGRHIQATFLGINIHNFYIPAGGEDPNPKINQKFQHKLNFINEMIDWSQKSKNENKKTIICGDFNVAPDKDDVWSHKQLQNTVSHTLIEREILNKLKHSGPWIDVIKDKIKPDENIYTWWSYRSPDYKKNNKGRRLDHIWVSADLKKFVVETKILSNTRSWNRPSDHVPVLIVLKI